MRVQCLGYNTARGRRGYNTGKHVINTLGRGSGYACSGKDRCDKRFTGTDTALNADGIIITGTPQVIPVLADKQ